jgi:hypothetical protein
MDGRPGELKNSNKPLSWPMPAMALCVHSNFFLQEWQDLCHEYFRKTWSFSRLMACWQRRGQINHLQIQSVLYFSLYEKTGSSLTLCHPSNKCAEHNKITEYFMWWPVCPVDSIYLRRSLLHTLGEDKKNLIPFSSAALFCRCAYIHNFQNVQTSGICFIQKLQPNARLWLKDINSKMGIVITCTTNAQGMSIANCYSIVLYDSYPTQCSCSCTRN